jgi:LVIVD repeat-containing protein
MKHAAPQGRRLKRLAVVGAVAIAAALLTAPASAAQTPTAPGTPPGVDEIASSPNLKQVAYLPKTGPFATSTNSDWAFSGHYAFGGNYNGFAVYDIRNPKAPTVAVQVLCPGSQNDISISGHLLFLGTDSQRSNDSCDNVASTTSAPGERWEGIKIFDISDPLTPVYLKSIKTDCGSHTQTLVPGKGRDPNVYLYVSSYNLAGVDQPNCALPHDKISIVKVPKRNPTAAAVIAAPVLFPDGGYPGEPGHTATTGCHDITVYAEKDLAAGACMGDGVLFDISNRAAPKVITSVRDTVNFAFWHSATFNNSGTKVVFTDELGGGGAATCNPEVGPDRGADGVYDIVGWGSHRKLVFRSYFKIPRTNTDTENCVAHNGSLIPVPGRDIMVQAWYQGGISVWDFTDSRRPKELAYWERGPISATQFIGGGSWSAYWYNGFIYSNDIAKGVDVLELKDPRTNLAKLFRTGVFNAQTQNNFLRW